MKKRRESSKNQGKKENKSEKMKEKGKKKKGEEEERDPKSEEAGKLKKSVKIEGSGKRTRGMTTAGGSGGNLGGASQRTKVEEVESTNKEAVPLRRPKRNLPISHSELNGNLKMEKREEIIRRIKEVNGEHASHRHSTAYAIGKSSSEFSKQLAQFEDSAEIFSPKDQKKKIQKKISVDHDMEVYLKKEKEELKKRGSRKPRSHIVNSSSSSNFNDPSSFSSPINDSGVMLRDNVDPTKKKKRFQIQSLSFRNVFS